MGFDTIKTGDSTILSASSQKENEMRADFYKLYEQCPIPKDQLLNNLGLFTKRQVLSRILMLNDMYKKIVNLHGIVCEFGVNWGNSLALFESFRGMYEPFNYNRKIVGFDTFEGFPSVHEKDGNSDIIKKGSYATTKNYEEYLEKVLQYHESEAPIPHIKKFELVKGDASVTVKKYLKDHPETIIAFAYFDFDIYEPTKACLEAILPHLTKGAVIGFDQMNFNEFQGETLAFKEVLGTNKFRIHRDINNPLPSYIIYE
ncbi:MAG TPA: class I SAM-dependent methyltransferase [Bacteroidia bacterium]|nr:class I SAM-dependent methyltransferase [Bacteroidia bacterium]